MKMADIGIAKAGVRAVTAAHPEQQGVQKTRPSKFDNIRSQLSERLTQEVKLPSAKRLSGQQAASLETALRKRLTQTVTNNPADVFASDMKTTRAELNKLTTAVNRMPDNKSSASIRDSLNSIESEYQNSTKLINDSKGMDMQALLKLQAQLYQMGENVQLLSKVVDQATSGVKTIFQTQVG
jgi:NAD+--asparagine ADP-ribosyltransferase